MLGSLIKGVVKREAKVMGANKLLGRGKKALSNRKQNVEQRRETARNMMSGRETGGGALFFAVRELVRVQGRLHNAEARWWAVSYTHLTLPTKRIV